MKIKTFLFTILLAIPTTAMADKATDKTSDKSTDRTQTTEKTSLSEDDIKVISHLKHTNDMEIQLGKLAKTNGTAATKAYGNSLVKDHTANNTKLTALAKKKGLSTIPMEEPTTEEQKQDHQAMMDTMAKLKTLRGAEFDQEFIPAMISDHDADIGKVDAAIASSKDADLVTFLKATRPVLQKHADAARELQKKSVSMK